MCHRCGITERRDEFNEDHSRRYLAYRAWNPSRPPLVTILANPAKYDAYGENATTRSVMGIACRNGFGSVILVNLDPRLSSKPLAKGPLNDGRNGKMLQVALGQGHPVWIGWGATMWPAAEAWMAVRPRNCKIVSLGKTRHGHPKHPGRKPYDSPLVAWID